MSWNIILAVIPQLAADAITLGEPELSFDLATDETEYGGTLLAARWQNGFVFVDGPSRSNEIAEASGAQLYRVSLGGAADTYVIEAVGEVNRLRVVSEGELAEDEGEPLSAESAFDHESDPEDAHFAIFDALAALPPNGIRALKFRPVLLDD